MSLDQPRSFPADGLEFSRDLTAVDRVQLAMQRQVDPITDKADSSIAQQDVGSSGVHTARTKEARAVKLNIRDLAIRGVVPIGQHIGCDATDPGLTTC